MSGQCDSCPFGVTKRTVVKKKTKPVIASACCSITGNCKPRTATKKAKKIVKISLATKTVAIKVVTRKVTSGTIKKPKATTAKSTTKTVGKSSAKLKPPVSKAKNVKSPKTTAAKPKK